MTFDRPQLTQRSAEPIHSLTPTLTEMREHQGRSIRNACEPDFVDIPGSPSSSRLSDKRLQYDGLAREALNRPGEKTTGPANENERQLSDQVADLALKVAKSFEPPTNSETRGEDIRAMRMLLKDLDPESAQRVIDGANRKLEPNNARIAQADTGEIWLGRRGASQPYHLAAPIMLATCNPTS